MNRLPLIGINMSIMATGEDGPGEARAPLGYIDAIESAGGIPICIPAFHDPLKIRGMLSFLQGFLFIGGADYRPEHYGGRPQPAEELVHPRRDRFDLLLAKMILDETDLPVLGICGGHQLLAIARGGALIQDIGTEWQSPGGGSPLPHSRKDRDIQAEREGKSDWREVPPGKRPEIRPEDESRAIAGPGDFPEAPPGKPADSAGVKGEARSVLKEEHCQPEREKTSLHAVRFLPRSLAARATGTPPGNSLATNSFHHQAVHPHQIGEDLIASAWTADGIIEAIEPAPGSAWAAHGRFVLGVQWHPERMQDEEAHRRLFRSLIQAAGVMQTVINT